MMTTKSHSHRVARLAEPSDTAAIERLLMASFIEYQHLYTVAGFQATVISEVDVLARMKEGPVWVVELDERIVGTVSIVISGRSLYVRGMAVHPSARGKRIGELLLTRIEQFAVSEGFERLFLSTTPFLHRAIRLYESLGFCRTDDGPKDLHGTPLFTMEKTLATNPLLNRRNRF